MGLLCARIRNPCVTLWGDTCIARTAYVEAKPYGAEQVRQAYLSAGDVYAVILQSRAGTAEAVPFQQTVVLQSQLLG